MDGTALFSALLYKVIFDSLFKLHN